MEKQLPKKINPDYIRDAIVQIRFLPKVHSEAVFGLVYGSIDDTYIVNEGKLPANSNHLDFSLKIDTAPEFYNDKIRVQVQPYSLVFNIKGGTGYIGWDSYFAEITRFLKQIKSEEIFDKIDFIGLRYISQYQNRDLGEIVEFKFGFGLPQITSKAYSFKSEFEFEGSRVILNLHNKLPANNIINNIIINETLMTHVDIDVNKRKEFSGSEIELVLEEIDNLHQLEKNVFWSIIKDSYKKEIEIIY